jgi:hypothetical protein
LAFAAVVLVGVALLRFRPKTVIERRLTQNATLSAALESAAPTITPVRPSPTLARRPIPSLPPETAAKVSEADQKNIGKILQAFNAPIDFYGKVVDEKGHPVAGAKVHYSAANHYFGDSSKYEGVSDGNGFFFITGINGAGVFVSVAKDGYYETKESGAGFGYGVPSGKQPPSKENPAIFVLRKKGETVPLVVWGKSQTIAKNGTPVSFVLSSGRVDPNGDLRIECWTNDESKNAQGRYDWKCRISVRDGGLIERKDSFAFEAPGNGYQPFDVIEMPQSAERWRSQESREYFVMLSGNQYCRIKFTMVAGSNHFFTITTYYNPQSGSRNLEPGLTSQIPSD